MSGGVLIIAVDREVRRRLSTALLGLGVSVEHAANGDEAAAILRHSEIEMVVSDGGTFDELRRSWPSLGAVLIADAGDSAQTIEAMKRGAIDCIVPPLRDDDVTRRLDEALRVCRDARAPVRPKPPRRRSEGAAVRLVGQSPAMQEVYRQIGLLAPRDINVLITGESGTGKELVARALHEHSRRGRRPFLEVNCAAIPETLLESELFGHEKGAFTGADRQRGGRFEEADGGTLLLDEVGDLPPATQAKLLRVLQEGTFQRLGGSGVKRVDVRVLAATHQPLEQMVAEKRFREDLYYRLRVATVHVPPLRDREVDAVLLAHHFIDRLNEQGQTQVRNFSPEAVSALLAYPWPGNVRELENVIKAAAVVARGPVFRLEHLPPRIVEGAASSPPTAAPAPSNAASAGAATGWTVLARELAAAPAHRGAVFSAVVGAAEKAAILAALERTQGRAAEAAELLGISRTTLRKKMRAHGVGVRRQPHEDRADII